MKLLSFQLFYNDKNLIKEYVYISGFYKDYLLYENINFSNQKVIVSDSIDFLFRKINNKNYCGKINLIGKANTTMSIYKNIDNILKVELLDEQGNVIKTAKAAESTIPKELRDKI